MLQKNKVRRQKSIQSIQKNNKNYTIFEKIEKSIFEPDENGEKNVSEPTNIKNLQKTVQKPDENQKNGGIDKNRVPTTVGTANKVGNGDVVSKNPLVNNQETKNSSASFGEIFIVKYRKLFMSDSKNLSVVNRIGWDNLPGPVAKERYHIMHVPTRTLIGTVFDDETNAINFMKFIDSEYDWNFTDTVKSGIDQENLMRLAIRTFGMGFFGKKN